MQKGTGWILTIVSILSVASIVLSAIVAGKVAGLSRQIGVLSPLALTTANATHPSTSSPTSNSTGQADTSTVNTANATGTTGTGAGDSSNTSFTNAEAVKIADSIPGIQNLLKGDSKAVAIPQGSGKTSKGLTYVSIEYADNMSDHVAALYWIDVRSDGMVRNLMTQSAWVKPSQFTLSN